MSIGTIAVLTFWQVVLFPVLAWGYARNPQWTGALGFARSRLGRSLALMLLASFNVTLGYDDRDVEEGVFIVGVVDFGFAALSIVSYACIPSGGFRPLGGSRADALNRVGGSNDDYLGNPFGRLEGES